MDSVRNQIVRDKTTGAKLWWEMIPLARMETKQEIVDPNGTATVTKVPNPATERCTCTTNTPMVEMTHKWIRYRVDVYAVQEKSSLLWGALGVIGVAAAVVGAVVLTGGLLGLAAGASAVFAGLGAGGAGMATGSAVLTGLGLLATGAAAGAYAVDELSDDEERGDLIDSREMWDADGAPVRGTTRVVSKSEDCDCNSTTTVPR